MAEFNINQISQELDCDCIIVDKVFASCQQRECFPEIEVEICEKKFERIRFRPGFIVPNTLIVTDTDIPNFRRVRFTIRIPFQILDCNGNIIAEGFLPDIFKDIILYIPDARDEFDFRIVIETSSEVLLPPVQTGDNLIFTAGVFIIIKVVGTVQLLIPTFGYCPPPPPCEEFSPQDICEDFLECAPFPEFFPPQIGDLECPPCNPAP
ncbi:hypothetical protein CIW83_07325 [Tissierella sp. P1]|jgi:hypothetical protein|uniref:hypothetical protein n=1 Tax=Tissierella TaxID=41273 RepID=UPI000BA170E1|nr:hypothetical protein [Tissierella sp. P1]MDU5081618.1 hypothetical protein [Bacillota bacterium]OZV12702.1 hypothetical protein CIW83_07325 [Tissierella sp. P1]